VKIALYSLPQLMMTTVEARDSQRVVRSIRRVPWEGAEAGGYEMQRLPFTEQSFHRVYELPDQKMLQ